jgi:CarD family transcriptional regulator
MPAAGGAAVFEAGDAVVHPHHGAGMVVSRSQRRLLGRAAQSYLEIEFADGALRIMVPCDAARTVGLRPVAGRGLVARISGVLESSPQSVPGTWSARLKHYRELLKGGDVLTLAAAVRDLAPRGTRSGLSSSEREFYQRARETLASELRYALDVDLDHAFAYIDERIARRPPPVA